MPSDAQLSARIAALAASQYGLVTSMQLRLLGVTARMVAHRRRTAGWELVQPGVYRLGGVPATWRQALRAATLAAGPDAFVSHRAAAALWGFEGFTPWLVELTSPRWRRRPAGVDVHLHETQDAIASDVCLVAGIPAATPLRIAIDIGCQVGPAGVEAVAVEAIRRGWFTHRDLRRRHRQIARPGRNGSRAVRLLLDHLATNERRSHSGWEVRLARLITRLGFPRPERQVRVLDDAGNLVAQVDLGYRREKIAIEADSETWHTGRTPFHRDRTRWNELTAAGWEVLIYTYDHYRHDHAHITRTLRAAFDARS